MPFQLPFFYELRLNIRHKILNYVSQVPRYAQTAKLIPSQKQLAPVDYKHKLAEVIKK
jgi:hypothetical protein